MADSGLVKFVERHLERLESGVDEILSNGSMRAVHRFRVSTRRLNEPLQLMLAVDSSVSKQVKKARKSLKKLRCLFGEVRDLDVLRAGLADEHIGCCMPGDCANKLSDMLGAMRRAAFVEALEGLSNTSPVQTASRIRNVLDDVCNKGGDKRQAALITAAKSMWRKRADAALEFETFEGDCAGFHELRIRLKGLRYCTELLYRMEDRDDDAVLAAFVRMQDALGAWNDHLFAARYLAQLATRDTNFANMPEWSAVVLECAGSRIRQSLSQRQDAIEQWPALREMICVARDGKSSICSKTVDATALADALCSVVGVAAKAE